MIVAIRSAKWGDVDSLEALLGFDEFEYLALFLWLAIAGAGCCSLDALLERWFERKDSDRPRRDDGRAHAVRDLHCCMHPM